MKHRIPITAQELILALIHVAGGKLDLLPGTLVNDTNVRLDLNMLAQLVAGKSTDAHPVAHVEFVVPDVQTVRLTTSKRGLA